MPTLTTDIRDALRDRFRDAFGDRLHQLVLYGSYARGDATPESDIDVLVVLDRKPDRADRKQAHEVMRHFTDEYGLNLSPLHPSGAIRDVQPAPLPQRARGGPTSHPSK